MDLDRLDDRAPGTHQIYCGGAQYITALGLRGVVQGSGKMGVDRLSRIDTP
jgi:hypothetical protein